jgi:pseudouridine synthase
MKVKLQKFIADNGYCSRRKAETLIEEGRVKVNGNPAKIGMRVDEKDNVVVEGKKIKTKKELLYIALNKPVGYVCTHKKEKGKKNIFSLVSDVEERLFVVGRLDEDSRGLVILTNDGDFAYHLTHPSFQHEKEYEVQVSKEPSESTISELLRGVNIGEKTRAKAQKIEKIGNKKYKLILTEGKKRQIRRMFEKFSCTVLDLRRIRIENYHLGTLKEGQWKYIQKK